MCLKPGQKLSPLLRLSPYLDTNKRKKIHATMVKTQFNFYPLMRMFCPKRPSNLTNKVQERALHITYNDQLKYFKSLINSK